MPRDNTSDEILETVKEVEALALGTSENYLQGIARPTKLIDKWRRHLGLPYFYGCGLPGRYYLAKNEAAFLPEIDLMPEAELLPEADLFPEAELLPEVELLRGSVNETDIELLPEIPDLSISTEA